MNILDLERKLGIDGMSADEQMALVVALQKSAEEKAALAREETTSKSADLVIQGLKRIKSDIEARFDQLNSTIQTKASSLKDGLDGKDGRDGKDGKNGRDGAKGDKGERGQDGIDGINGVDGVSVTNAHIDFDGSLVITLSTGVELNVGEVVAPDLAESIKVITNGGGTSQFVIDTLASLQTQITNVTGSALTKTDDTNVTLTLGGSPTTALLNAASLTLGWTGTLATTRGGTGLSSFTANGVMYASSTSALATSSNFTYDGNNVVNGSSGTGTNAYGFQVSSSLTGATNNYAFYGNIASASNRWNLYMNGTAANYLAGSLGIGTTGLTDRNLGITKTITGATSAYGINQNSTIQSDVTIIAAINQTNPSTAAAAFTLATLSHYRALQNTIGSGSTVTNQYGFEATSVLTGATNNYGFYGNIASGAGRYNFYAAGTAANYFAGDMQFNKTVTAAGTTGAQTINKNAGTVNFAAAATSLVVTNSLVTTSSIIICTVGTNDTTMKSVSAVAASGSFTIYANAAATAETRVNFIVIN